MKLIKSIFSGEVYFALFLLSGAFKESITLLPFDLAAVFLILTMISIVYRFMKNPSIQKYNFLPIALFLSLLGMVLFSLYYNPNMEMTQDKTIKFLFLTTPAFVFPFYLFKTKESLTRFLIAIATIATTMALFSLPLIFQRGSLMGFVGFNDGNYLGLARVGGIGVAILLFLGLLNERFKKWRVVFLIATVVVLISLLASGARMPIISVFTALVVTVLSSIKIKGGVIRYPKYYNKILGLSVGLMIPMIWAYNKGFFNSVTARFEVLLNSNNGGASASARTDRLHSAFNMWSDNLIAGNGFGSFGQYYKNTAAYDYPHNLFMEVVSELGLIGMIIIVSLILVAVFRFLKLGKLKEIRNHNLYITVTVTFLVVFINAMVSGDINGNRILLTFVSILCVLPLIFRSEINKVSS